MVTRRLFTRCRRAVFVTCITVLLTGCRNGGSNSNGAAAGDTTATVDNTGSTGAHFYRTTFPLTENPMSEGKKWVGGSSGGASVWAGGHFWKGGRLWGDIQTTPGFAYGVDEPSRFGDPTAILTGAWGPTQTVAATVKINKAPTGDCCHEVELRLRTSISSKSITGYEAYCSVMPDNPYCHIARWNGPNGSYWNFETGSSATYLAEGDVIKATATGTNPTVITLSKNGAQILQATDNGAAGGGFGPFGPWISGNPGIGFYDSRDSNWKYFGFSSFSATDRP